MLATKNVTDEILAVAKQSRSKPPKKQGRSPAYTLYARIDPELGAAFEDYINHTKPKPTNTSAVELALEEFLRDKGFWPRQASGAAP